MNEYHVYHTIQDHVTAFFAGHRVDHVQWTLGPMPSLFPEFRVLQISPGPKTGNWVYISLGTWQVNVFNSPRLEFIVIAPDKDLQYVELLTAAAYYHHMEHLDLGHTFPLGEPLSPNSLCTHMQVSLPYPFGPDLEICRVDGEHIHLYWLLPITAAENQYVVQKGTEALEQIFDREALEYWDFKRKSLV